MRPIFILLLILTSGLHIAYAAQSDLSRYAQQARAWGSSIAEIAEHLGEPETIQSNPAVLRHDQLSSERVTLDYGFIQLVVARFTYGQPEQPTQKELLSAVTIYHCDPAITFECYIGKTNEAVLADFGIPAQHTASEIRYWVRYGDAGSSPMIFRLTDGRVQSVKINIFID